MKRVLAALALAIALVAPAFYGLAQTNPLPGQIGDVTFKNITVQESVAITGNAAVTGNTTITGNLTVAGTTSAAGAPNYGVDAGSNDTYVATLSPVPAAYVTGRVYVLKAATANTGAASVNFNGLGAKTIVKAVSTTLADNDILAAMLCLLVYDGTNMVLLNPRAL